MLTIQKTTSFLITEQQAEDLFRAFTNNVTAPPGHLGYSAESWGGRTLTLKDGIPQRTLEEGAGWDGNDTWCIHAPTSNVTAFTITSVSQTCLIAERSEDLFECSCTWHVLRWNDGWEVNLVPSYLRFLGVRPEYTPHESELIINAY